MGAPSSRNRRQGEWDIMLCVTLRQSIGWIDRMRAAVQGRYALRRSTVTRADRIDLRVPNSLFRSAESALRQSHYISPIDEKVYSKARLAVGRLDRHATANYRRLRTCRSR